MAGPPPHGQATGPVRLDHKSKMIDGSVLLEFFILGRTSYPRGFALPVSEEVGEYFVVGQTYQHLFTQP
jgi:hypothetical protein